MRHLLFLICLLGTAFGIRAQLWMEEPQPQSVSQASCDMVNDPQAPCNIGGEALSEFMARFCSDMEFQASRISPDLLQDTTDLNGNPAEPWLLEWLRDAQREKPLSFVPREADGECQTYLDTWYGVTGEHALFYSYRSCERCADPDMLGADFDYGGTVYWVFGRKEWKWYLTDWVVIG